MKKIFLAVFLLFGLFTTSVCAQPGKPPESTPKFSLSDSADFVGKYKYEGLPFDYMTISVKETKFYYSGGEYSGFLEPLKDKKDVFDAGGVAVFSFTRDADSKVKELVIDYQGQTHTGKKEEK